TQETDLLNAFSWERYGDYLEGLKGKKYREDVLAYVAREDSPRSINYQRDLTKKVGFKNTEILHKNMCFGVIGGIKSLGDSSLDTYFFVKKSCNSQLEYLTYAEENRIGDRWLYRRGCHFFEKCRSGGKEPGSGPV